MLRKLLIFSAVLAVSITASNIRITGQRRGAQPSAASTQRNAEPRAQQTAQQQDQPPIPYEQYERDIRSLSDELEAIREQAAQANRNSAEQENEWSWWFGSDPPIWSNWFLAVIAVIAGIVAYRTFNQEREALHLTQAADVHFEEIVAPPDGRLRPDSILTIIFKNYGPTRAVKANFGWAFWLGEAAQIPVLGESHIVVPAHERQPIPSDTTFATAMGEWTSDATSGKIPFGFVAALRFEDVFGNVVERGYMGTYHAGDQTFTQDMTADRRTTKKSASKWIPTG